MSPVPFPRESPARLHCSPSPPVVHQRWAFAHVFATAQSVTWYRTPHTLAPPFCWHGLSPFTLLHDTLLLPLLKPFTLYCNYPFSCLGLFLTCQFAAGRVSGLTLSSQCHVVSTVDEEKMSQPVESQLLHVGTGGAVLPQGARGLALTYRMHSNCHRAWHRVGISHLAAQYQPTEATEGLIPSMRGRPAVSIVLEATN